MTIGVGLANRQDMTVSYNLVYQINDGDEVELGTLNLDAHEIWEKEWKIHLLDLPAMQKINLLFLNPDTGETQAALHYWVNTSDTR
jgi:hypothetical protein